MLHLFGRQLRTRGIAARWIADESGAVADDERHLMTEILELAQLAQGNGVSDMDIGSSWVDAKLDVERFSALQLFEESAFGHDAIDATRNDMKLLFCRKHMGTFPLYVRRDSSTVLYERNQARRDSLEATSIRLTPMKTIATLRIFALPLAVALLVLPVPDRDLVKPR